MSADVKIRILADTTEATEGIQGVYDAGYKAEDSFRKLAKAMGQQQTALRDGTGDMERYNALQKEAAQYLDVATMAMAAQGKQGLATAKELVRYYDIAMRMGGTELAGSVKGRFDEQMSIHAEEQKAAAEAARKAAEEKAKAEEEARKATEAAAEAQRKLNEAVKEELVLISGDPIARLKYQYGQLEEQLKSTVRAYKELDGRQDDASVQKAAELREEAARLRQQMTDLEAEMRRPEEDRIKALEAQKQAQEELNEAVRKGVVIAKDDAAEKLAYDYKELEKQLKDTVTRMEKLRRAGQEDSDAFRKLGDEAQTLSGKMKETRSQMDKMGKTGFATRMANLAKSFISAQMAVYLLRKAWTSLVSIIRESAQAAAEAEETYNLFITTFEGVASTAENTAFRLSKSLGMATSTAQKALGTFGDLLLGYGATDKAALEFAETAAQTILDITSYKNLTGSMDEIFQSFASGLAGNVENFRKLGYIVTQAEVKTALAKKGLDKLTGSSLQAAMVQERLNIVLAKSAKAQGDMEKTLDSTLNVNRRLTEAWKEYKENLGKDVNEVMRPLKKWWLEILEVTNKAVAAKNAMLQGVSTEGIFDVEGNAKDRQAFLDSISGAFFNAKQISDGSRLLTNHNGMEEEYEAYVSTLTGELADVMRTFHVDADTIIRYLTKNQKINSDIESRLRDLYRQMEASERERKADEEHLNSIIERSQSIQGLFDSLNGITGVNVTQDVTRFQNSGYTGTSLYKQIAEGAMADALGRGVEEALASMAAAGWEEFVDPTKLALGTATKSDGLTEQMNQLSSMYELLRNWYLADGKINEQERQVLSKLESQYTGIGNAVKALSELEGIRGTRATWQSRIDELKGGNDTAEAAIARFSEEIFNLLDTIEDIDLWNQIADMGAETINLIREYYDLRKEQQERDRWNAVSAIKSEMIYRTPEKYTKTTRMLNGLSYEAMESYNEAMIRANETLVSYEKRLKDAGATETEMSAALGTAFRKLESEAYDAAKALDKAAIEEAWKQNEANRGSWWKNSVTAYQPTGNEELDEANLANLKQDMFNSNMDALVSAFGDVGQLVTAGMNAAAGSTGDLVAMLVELASKLDIVQKIGSMLTDSTLPVLNTMLAPLTGLVEKLGGILTDMFAIAFQPLYRIIVAVVPVLSSLLDIIEPLWELLHVFTPILDGILQALGLVIGVVNGIAKEIVAIVQWLAGWILKSVAWCVNGVVGIINGLLQFVGVKNRLKGMDTSGYDEWTSVFTGEDGKTDFLKPFKDGFKEVVAAMDVNNNLLEDVRKNTDQSADERLKYLAEMYDNGLIDRDVYHAQRADITGEKWDKVRTYEGGSYWNAAGGKTTVISGGVTISIDGNGLDSDEVARKVKKILEDILREGGNTYAYA